MIIGIDISSIPYGTGVSTYTLNLVRNLLKIDKINTYKLFFSSLRQPLPPEIKILLKTHPNLKIYHYYFPPSLLEFLWNRLHIFPIEFFIGKCDIFHTWDWTQPPTIWAKTVTTVHDLVPFLYPETQHPTTIAVFKRKFKQALPRCSAFICVSQSTKADVKKLFPQITENKLSVIFEAAEEKYSQFSRLPLQKRQRILTRFKKLHGLNHYVLAQGTREPRKNLDRLIKAFELYRHRHPDSKIELAITGKYGWGQDIASKSKNYIKILGYIAEKDLVALHAAAICLCYPSLYEGFGLPVLKSLCVGIPVITSNISSLPEVAGPAAVYVDPHSLESIETGLEKVLGSNDLRVKLKKLGLRQSQKFSWSVMAAETLKIYQNL